MARENAVFGGEHSGHYYFRDFWFADSGMLAAMHVLSALAGQAAPLSALLAPFDPYVNSGEVNSTVADAHASAARVRAEFVTPDVKADDMDGLTVSHWEAEPRRWFNVRPSNTEPLLRLNVEAAERTVMEDIRDRMFSVIRAGA
jgi:phosphomannomutase